jgi:4'-phosphopantetheinyl transferase EntD
VAWPPAASECGSPVGRLELERMFDGHVVVLTAPIDAAATEALGVHEAAIVARSVAKRRNEFATARRLAREALAHFGVANFELIHDSNRAPIWPLGISGSLSHCSTSAFAAVGRRDEAGTLGIDVEDRPTLPEELWPLVLVKEELVFLDGVSPADRGRLALVIFSAKESLYKAQYPRTHEFMDFFDVRVDVTGTSRDPRFEGTLSCAFQRDVGSFDADTVVPGRFRELGPSRAVVTTVQIR